MEPVAVHTLDLRFQGEPGVIAAFLVEGPEGLALIETGPGSTLPALREGLAGLGVAPERVGDVFVTHIHLDHAGAAGWWARQGATVHVHPRARRISSIRRVCWKARGWCTASGWTRCGGKCCRRWPNG